MITAFILVTYALTAAVAYALGWSAHQYRAGLDFDAAVAQALNAAQPDPTIAEYTRDDPEDMPIPAVGHVGYPLGTRHAPRGAHRADAGAAR